jgi:hypothetical protein
MLRLDRHRATSHSEQPSAIAITITFTVSFAIPDTGHRPASMGRSHVVSRLAFGSRSRDRADA